MSPVAFQRLEDCLCGFSLASGNAASDPKARFCLYHGCSPNLSRRIRAAGIGRPVDEVPVAAADLPEADELFLMGTTTGIMPVVQVEDWMVGDGTPGPVTQDLLAAFRALDPA
jgi:hypothetical protein